MLRKMFVLTLFLLSFGSYALAEETNVSTKGEAPKVVDEAVPNRSDESLTETVTTALKADASLQPFLKDIQVKTVGGIVNLKGTVNAESEKKAIEDKVRTCPNVADIQSYIQVIRA